MSRNILFYCRILTKSWVAEMEDDVDDDAEAFRAVTGLVLRRWKQWEVYPVIEKWLRERQSMPLDIMAAFGTTEVS